MVTMNKTYVHNISKFEVTSFERIVILLKSIFRMTVKMDKLVLRVDNKM